MVVHLFVAEDTKLIRMLQIHFIEEHASEVIESTDNYGTVDKFGEYSSKVAFLDIQLPDEKDLNSVYDAINSILKARYLFRILDPHHPVHVPAA